MLGLTLRAIESATPIAEACPGSGSQRDGHVSLASLRLPAARRPLRALPSCPSLPLLGHLHDVHCAPRPLTPDVSGIGRLPVLLHLRSNLSLGLQSQRCSSGYPLPAFGRHTEVARRASLWNGMASTDATAAGDLAWAGRGRKPRVDVLPLAGSSGRSESTENVLNFGRIWSDLQAALAVVGARQLASGWLGRGGLLVGATTRTSSSRLHPFPTLRCILQ